MWSKKIIYNLRPQQQIHCFRYLSKTSRPTQSTQLQEKEAPGPVKEYKDTPPPSHVKTLKKFKEPFPKCFFAGKCDPEVLEYPEVLNLQQIDKINQLADEIQAVVKHEINPKKTTSPLPKKVLDKINNFTLCGAKLPLHYHGLGMSETEGAVLSEATALNADVNKYVCEQQNLAGALLAKYGSNEQKQRYLSALVLGKSIIACAYQESTALSDSHILETVALPDGKGGFEITGSKVWVYNAADADTFIVFAGTVQKDDTGQRKPALTAFIVPADAPGVTLQPAMSKIALHGVQVNQVNFKDVKVGPNAILGEIYQASAMMMSTMGNKFDLGPLVVGVGKNLLEIVTRHLISTNYMGSAMSELEGAKVRLGGLATALYRLESALYLQKGHADLYENADSFLELCILKILSSKTLDFMIKESFQLLGPEAVSNTELSFLGKLVKESALYSVCDDTNINLKSAIALSGVQHAGLSVHEEIRKVRNPFMFPSFVMKKIFEGKKRYGGSKGKDLGLAGYLHPTLEDQAHNLEFCISRIMYCTETLLARHGLEIMNKHIKLAHLADMTITTYALTAVLARASRSYCIGLSEAAIEMEMALAVSRSTEREICIINELIDDGSASNNTMSYNLISERILFNKGFSTERPIARNF